MSTDSTHDPATFTETWRRLTDPFRVADEWTKAARAEARALDRLIAAEADPSAIVGQARLLAATRAVAEAATEGNQAFVDLNRGPQRESVAAFFRFVRADAAYRAALDHWTTLWHALHGAEGAAEPNVA